MQFPQRQLLKSVLAEALGPQYVIDAALGPIAHPSRSARPPLLRRLRGPNITFGKLPLGKLHIRKVVAWEIVTWEVALGKMPLGKCLWENAFGKVPYYLTPTQIWSLCRFYRKSKFLAIKVNPLKLDSQTKLRTFLWFSRVIPPFQNHSGIEGRKCRA